MTERLPGRSLEPQPYSIGLGATHWIQAKCIVVQQEVDHPLVGTDDPVHFCLIIVQGREIDLGPPAERQSGRIALAGF